MNPQANTSKENLTIMSGNTNQLSPKEKEKFQKCLKKYQKIGGKKMAVLKKCYIKLVNSKNDKIQKLSAENKKLEEKNTALKNSNDKLRTKEKDNKKQFESKLTNLSKQQQACKIDLKTEANSLFIDKLTWTVTFGSDRANGDSYYFAYIDDY